MLLPMARALTRCRWCGAVRVPDPRRCSGRP